MGGAVHGDLAEHYSISHFAIAQEEHGLNLPLKGLSGAVAHLHSHGHLGAFLIGREGADENTAAGHFASFHRIGDVDRWIHP
jgi:hypothetical protein